MTALLCHHSGLRACAHSYLDFAVIVMSGGASVLCVHVNKVDEVPKPTLKRRTKKTEHDNKSD